MIEKQQLRKQVLQLRNSLTSIERQEKSQTITNCVSAFREFQEADQYLLFFSFRSEVDTTELLRQALSTHKPVYLPKVLGKEMKFYQIENLEELEMGYQGILEPKEDKQREFIPSQKQKIFVLIPGVVFDREGGRIGYGGGFYDKYLSRLEGEIIPENLCKLAVAYECQLVENGLIHREAYDISPNYIVIEDGCIRI